MRFVFGYLAENFLSRTGCRLVGTCSCSFGGRPRSLACHSWLGPIDETACPLGMGRSLLMETGTGQTCTRLFVPCMLRCAMQGTNNLLQVCEDGAWGTPAPKQVGALRRSQNAKMGHPDLATMAQMFAKRFSGKSKKLVLGMLKKLKCDLSERRKAMPRRLRRALPG